MLYKAVDLVDGELVAYLGVYVLHWGQKEPTIGFRVATKDEVLAEMKKMEQEDGNLRQG